MAEQVCRYDLDDMDVYWLRMVNNERDSFGKNLYADTTQHSQKSALAYMAF